MRSDACRIDIFANSAPGDAGAKPVSDIVLLALMTFDAGPLDGDGAPRTFLLTNITSQHLEFHGTLDAYRAAKAKAFGES